MLEDVLHTVVILQLVEMGSAIFVPPADKVLAKHTYPLATSNRNKVF